MGSPSSSSSNAAEEGRTRPRFSSKWKCLGGIRRRSIAVSGILESSGKFLAQSSGVLKTFGSLSGDALQPRPQFRLVARQGVLATSAGLYIFSKEADRLGRVNV